MRIIGIDPGKTGYIVEIDNMKYANEYIIPTLSASKKTAKRDYNVSDLWSVIKVACEGVSLVVIEKQQARPAPEGRGSIFSTGRGFGLVEGMVAAMGVPYIMPHPKTWQKVMLRDIPGTNTKSRSIIAASRLFPNVSLKRTERCRKPDHNKADAILLAVYGAKYMQEGQNNAM